MISFELAEAFARNETDPNYDFVDPHVLNFLLMTVAYSVVFAVPIIWGLLVIFTKGETGTGLLVGLIYYWSSNMTLVNIILAVVLFSLFYLGSLKEIWYISSYLFFSLIMWVITMVTSFDAIQYCEPGWLKIAPGWVWPSLFFINNDLDGYLAEKQR